jgi:hypothetical protein
MRDDIERGRDKERSRLADLLRERLDTVKTVEGLRRACEMMPSDEREAKYRELIQPLNDKMLVLDLDIEKSKEVVGALDKNLFPEPPKVN